MIFISLETLSISSYLMTGYTKRDPRSNEAALKYLLIGAASTAVFLYGVSLLYGLSGTNAAKCNRGWNCQCQRWSISRFSYRSSICGCRCRLQNLLPSTSGHQTFMKVLHTSHCLPICRFKSSWVCLSNPSDEQPFP